MLRASALSFVLFFLSTVSAYVGSATISSTVLIIARDATHAENSAAIGLRGYGIPYEVLAVPQAGIANLPVLNSSATNANYGAIVVCAEVGYNYDTSYYSALTRRQWNDLYAYQSTFGIRMVRLDVFLQQTSVLPPLLEIKTMNLSFSPTRPLFLLLDTRRKCENLLHHCFLSHTMYSPSWFSDTNLYQ